MFAGFAPLAPSPIPGLPVRSPRVRAQGSMCVCLPEATGLLLVGNSCSLLCRRRPNQARWWSGTRCSSPGRASSAATACRQQGCWQVGTGPWRARQAGSGWPLPRRCCPQRGPGRPATLLRVPLAPCHSAVVLLLIFFWPLAWLPCVMPGEGARWASRRVALGVPMCSPCRAAVRASLGCCPSFGRVFPAARASPCMWPHLQSASKTTRGLSMAGQAKRPQPPARRRRRRPLRQRPPPRRAVSRMTTCFMPGQPSTRWAGTQTATITVRAALGTAAAAAAAAAVDAAAAARLHCMPCGVRLLYESSQNALHVQCIRSTHLRPRGCKGDSGPAGYRQAAGGEDASNSPSCEGRPSLGSPARPPDACMAAVSWLMTRSSCQGGRWGGREHTLTFQPLASALLSMTAACSRAAPSLLLPHLCGVLGQQRRLGLLPTPLAAAQRSPTLHALLHVSLHPLAVQQRQARVEPGAERFQGLRAIGSVCRVIEAQWIGHRGGASPPTPCRSDNAAPPPTKAHTYAAASA